MRYAKSPNQTCDDYQSSKVLSQKNNLYEINFVSIKESTICEEVFRYFPCRVMKHKPIPNHSTQISYSEYIGMKGYCDEFLDKSFVPPNWIPRLHRSPHQNNHPGNSITIPNPPPVSQVSIPDVGWVFVIMLFLLLSQ